MRYKILKKITSKNGINIYNPTSVKWNEFEFTNGYKKHVVSKNEILKPYMISYQYYDTVEYDDLLLSINGIDNIFDFEPGIEIKIPYIEDIEAFILKYKQ